MAKLVKRETDHLAINILDHPESLFVKWNLPLAFQDSQEMEEGEEPAGAPMHN